MQYQPLDDTIRITFGAFDSDHMNNGWSYNETENVVRVEPEAKVVMGRLAFFNLVNDLIKCANQLFVPGPQE